jgi:1-acyl-sn-glycerol-3-phosphate acyltransferase
MILARSILFFACQLVLTPFFCLAMLLALPFGHRRVYALTKAWTGIIVELARRLCGIDYRIVGTERIPRTPTIVLSKHQSAWETFFFLHLFPPQVWLLKRELLRIPFFGWGLAMLKPIAIDRSAKLAALKQLAEQGRDRLAHGLWIVIFPEGTRTAPGESRPFARGGAWLATKTGAPVLPVALNSGTCWAKDTFLKHPGTITVSIGPPIDSRGLSAEELNEQARAWIESEMRHLMPAG